MTDSIDKNTEKMSFDDIKKISEGIMSSLGSNLVVSQVIID
jgi:hypothetical protein